MASPVEGISKPIFIVGRPIGINYPHLVSWAAPEHHSPRRIELAGAFCDRCSRRLSTGAHAENADSSVQISSNAKNFLATLGESINELILGHRTKFEDANLREQAGWYPPAFPFPDPKASQNRAGWTERRNTPFTSTRCVNFSRRPSSFIWFAMSPM